MDVNVKGSMSVKRNDTLQFSSEKVAYTTIIEWSISDFQTLKKGMDDSILSPRFDVGSNKETTWNIVFTPGGRNENPQTFASLHMVSCNLSGNTALGKCTIYEEYTLPPAIIKVKSNLTRFSLKEGLNFNLPAKSFVDVMDTISMSTINYIRLTVEIIIFACDICDGIEHFAKERRVVSDIENLFDVGTLADVTLTASNGQELNAHKAILGARSPVFLAMFMDDMFEKNENKVEIEDIEYNVLHKMVHYMYTGRLREIDSKLALKLIVAADKYSLDDLKSECEEQFLNCSITNEDAVELLRIAFMHDTSEKFKGHAVSFIKRNMKEVKTTECWKILKDKYSRVLAEALEFQLDCSNEFSIIPIQG